MYIIQYNNDITPICFMSSLKCLQVGNHFLSNGILWSNAPNYLTQVKYITMYDIIQYVSNKQVHIFIILCIIFFYFADFKTQTDDGTDYVCDGW